MAHQPLHYRSAQTGGERAEDGAAGGAGGGEKERRRRTTSSGDFLTRPLYLGGGIQPVGRWGRFLGRCRGALEQGAVAADTSLSTAPEDRSDSQPVGICSAPFHQV